MHVPNWVKKKIPYTEEIECTALGRCKITFEGKSVNHNNAALVGTTLGLHFLTRGLLLGGFSYVGSWEKFADKAHLYASGGFLGTNLIIEIDNNKLVLRTSKNESNNFLSYIASKRSEKDRLSKHGHFSSSVDLVQSIKDLKELKESSMQKARYFGIHNEFMKT